MAFSDAELVAFLDEALPVERMTALEQALREDTELTQRLVRLRGQRDAGVHSLAEIWRRHRISCPSREELGRFLLEVLEPAAADFIRFHVAEDGGCRVCQANLADLKQAQAADIAAASRRQRYFQSSAGRLKPT